MAQYKKLAELFEELEKITPHKKIIRKIAEFETGIKYLKLVLNNGN